jgi:transcription elongation factor SPT5
MGGGGRGFNRDPLKDKDVKIIKGPYKGHFGKVIDANEKTIRVELTSKMKNVTLSRDKVKDLSPDAPAGGFGLTGLGGGARGGGFQAAPGAGGGGGFPSFGGGGAGGRTPLHGSGMTPHGGRTPLNFGGRTPVGGGLSAFGGLGNRTPSHGGAFGAGNRTPAHPGFGGLPAPRTPAHTAFRPTTPARADEYGGFGSFGGPPAAASANPYATYSAPVPTTPGTPHMLPVTPAGGGYGAHAADPRTPADPSMVPQTPVDQYSMPQTPQMAMEPQTPLPYGDVHTPGGPVGVPQTPATPEPSTPMPETPAPMDEPATPAPGQEGDVASQGYKVLIDVVVSVPDMNGRSAVVTNAAFDGAFVNVSMLDTGEQVVLNGQQFTPVQPAIEEGADNLVKVLDGAFAGRIGRLASMDARDGVACGTIDFGGGEVHVLDMEFVAKYRRAG